MASLASDGEPSNEWFEPVAESAEGRSGCFFRFALMLLVCFFATTVRTASLLPNVSVSRTPPSYTRLPDVAEPCCKPRPATWTGMLTFGGKPHQASHTAVRSRLECRAACSALAACRFFSVTRAREERDARHGAGLPSLRCSLCSVCDYTDIDYMDSSPRRGGRSRTTARASPGHGVLEYESFVKRRSPAETLVQQLVVTTAVLHDILVQAIGAGYRCRLYVQIIGAGYTCRLYVQAIGAGYRCSLL